MKITGKKMVIILFAILSIITAVVVYMQNRLIPFMMDDIWYQTKLSSDEPITCFRDIVESQIWHYNNWGGRSMAHALLQMILLLGEKATDILNVAVTFLLAGIMSKTAGVKIRYGMFGAVAMLFGFNANWRMSMCWQSGAANYLYMMVFILSFLYCYIREDMEKRLYGITFWIVPLGLIAGWSNENVGPALWCISLFVIIREFWKNHTLKVWMVLGNISCFIGSVLMILAPGNSVRNSEIAANEYGILWQTFLRCYAESKAAFEYMFGVILLLLLLVFVCKGILQIPLGKTTLYLIACAVLSWGAMILSPHYPDRATFGTMALFSCACLSLMKNICMEKEKSYKYFTFVILFIWLGGMFYQGENLAIVWGWIK